MATSSGRGPLHLVVLVHGYDGGQDDLLNMERAILGHRKKHAHASSNVVCLRAAMGGTHDGIERGAIRLWRQVRAKETELSELLKKTGTTNERGEPPKGEISFVCHSLGGLYARFALRLLADCGLFDRWNPHVFVTLASPHLGIRRESPSHPFDLAFHAVASRANTTTIDLAMEDSRDAPLLYRMTAPSFLDVLRRFRRRVAYANVRNDFQVGLRTAHMCVFHPYESPDQALELGLIPSPAAVYRRSEEFPSLTEISVRHPDRPAVFNRREEEQGFFASDAKRTLLLDMVRRLNSPGLTWERFDALFATVFAHEQIVCKRGAFWGGVDMGRHVAAFIHESP